MKNLPLVSVLVLAGVTGCDRIAGLFGHGADPVGSTGSAPGAPAAAPAANNDLPSLAGFEGEIDLLAKGKSSPAPVALNLLVKNDIVRLDVPSDLLSASPAARFVGDGRVYAILRAAEKKAFVVLDAKRQAIVLNLDQVGDQAKSFRHGPPGGQDTPAADPPKVVKTGKREIIAGYSCEDWDVLSADRSKVSTCVADKGASFFRLPLTGIPTENAWALELMDGNHFPLRGAAFDRDGSQSGSVEVTKLDKRSLDASQFEVPAGYKQLTLDEMMQGLGGGGLPGEIPKNLPHPGPHGPHHHGHH